MYFRGHCSTISIVYIFDDFHFNIRERNQWGRERPNWTVDSHSRTNIYSDESQIIVGLNTVFKSRVKATKLTVRNHYADLPTVK